MIYALTVPEVQEAVRHHHALAKAGYTGKEFEGIVILAKYQRKRNLK